MSINFFKIIRDSIYLAIMATCSIPRCFELGTAQAVLDEMAKVRIT